MDQHIPTPAEASARNRAKREHAARTARLQQLCLTAIADYDDAPVCFDLPADLVDNVADVQAAMTGWGLAVLDGKLYLGTPDEIATLKSQTDNRIPSSPPATTLPIPEPTPGDGTVSVPDVHIDPPVATTLPLPGEDDGDTTAGAAAVAVVPAEPAQRTFDVFPDLRRGKASLGVEPLPKVFRRLLTTDVEACGGAVTQLVRPLGFHGLLEAAHRAFAGHYGLRLSPDHIWVTIAQGFARLVNQEPELFRGKFVSHDGRKMIKIRRDGFVMGDPDNDWRGCFAEFSDAIRGYIGDEKHALLVSDFGTTGDIERATSEVVLMDTVQAYFVYRVETRCGIPFITLDGSVSDWQKLQSKVTALRQFGELGWWLDEVDAIVAQFVRAAGGDVDTDFWSSIYKYQSGSGHTALTGWLVKLLPLVKDPYSRTEVYKRNPLLGEHQQPFEATPDPDKYDNGVEIDGESVATDSLPASLSTVPFEWDYHGTIHNYQFVAGIIGYVQENDGQTIVPQMGWAVRPAPAKK